MITPFVALLVIIVDQATKFLVNDFFISHHASVPIIPSVFHLTYVKNTGVAFGLFKNHPQLLLGIILGSVVALMIYLRYLKEENNFLKIAYGFIIGGALGNLFDRIRLGWVVDFLDFRIWPVFNGADSFITVGVTIILIDIIFLSKKKIKSK